MDRNLAFSIGASIFGSFFICRVRVGRVVGSRHNFADAEFAGNA